MQELLRSQARTRGHIDTLGRVGQAELMVNTLLQQEQTIVQSERTIKHLQSERKNEKKELKRVVMGMRYEIPIDLKETTDYPLQVSTSLVLLG